MVSVIDSNGRPVPDAVAYMENILPVKKAISGKQMTAEIEQKDKKFIPLVSVIQTRTCVFFPNNDTVKHHAYSFSAAKPFELKLYAGKPEAPIVFDKPGTVVIGCHIHDQMLAYIQVVDTPNFAKTDAGGKAKMTQLQNGQYFLRVWHYKQIPDIANDEQSLSVNDADLSVQVRLTLRAN